MNTTIRLLDALKSSGLGTDYAIAKHFKRTRSNVSRWRHGMDQMNDDMAIQVAEHLGIDPVEVLAELRIERGQTEAERKYWEQWREDFRMLKLFKNERVQHLLADPQARAEVEKAIDEVAAETGADAEKMKRSPLLKPIFAAAMMVFFALPVGLTTRPATAANASTLEPNCILCYPKRRRAALLVA